jgi:hypothetical protein
VEVLRTASQNLAPSLSCHQIPSASRSPFDGDADGEIAGAVTNRAVLAQPDLQRVELDDRVHRLQRPRAPGGDVVEHGVGDPRDRVATDPRA